MRRAVAIALCLGFFGVAQRSHAADAADVRVEARERFDRGLRLFNRGDNAGALAEFTRAHELVPHPLVLYNIAMVQAALGDAVAAVQTLDRLLAAPGSLPSDKLSRARRERDDQRARLVALDVRANVAGATVELDGVEIGTSPLAAPVTVTNGRHVVSVVAPGYAPLRRVVTLAGPSARLDFELIPLETTLARLTLHVRLPEVQVLVNGEPAGVTPLPAALALPPGEHVIALQRPGYVPFERRVVLGPGAAGKLLFEPLPDPRALAREGGELLLSVSEDDAVVFVDGKPVPRRTKVVRLPRGAHRLRVERAEFFAFERDVVIPVGRRVELSIELEPTPVKRAEYRSAALRTRTLGWIGVGAGAVFAAGAGGFLIWNQGEETKKKRAFEVEADRFEPFGDCDPKRGLDSDVCHAALELSLERLEAARGRTVYGYIGLGAAAAFAATGLTLLLSGDDPNRYEPGPESDVFGRFRLFPVVGSEPGVVARTAF